MTDIVERLREFGDWIEDPSGRSFTYPERIIHEAADEIERLRSENQKLNRHIDLLQTRLYLNKIPHRVEGIDDVPDSQNV